MSPSLKHTGIQPKAGQTEKHTITHGSAQKRPKLSFVERVDRNGNTLPTSRTIRLRSPLFESATRRKVRHSRCLPACGITVS
jgi:hypothetical protein